MAENRLERMFESGFAARVQNFGAENLVELSQVAFLCEPCGFSSSTQEVLLTRDDCARQGIDPEEVLLDNAAFQGTPSEAAYFQGLVDDALPKWQIEARKVRTGCAARLGEQSCKGTVRCMGLYRTLPEEA
jgi:hypothetical protein